MTPTHPWTWRLVATLAVIAGGLTLLYLSKTIAPHPGADADVPPASALSLPAGTTITRVDKVCDTGDCWSLFTVLPAEGSTVNELATQLQAIPLGSIPGTVLDPRSIHLSVETHNEAVIIKADY